MTTMTMATVEGNGPNEVAATEAGRDPEPRAGVAEETRIKAKKPSLMMVLRQVHRALQILLRRLPRSTTPPRRHAS